MKETLREWQGRPLVAFSVCLALGLALPVQPWIFLVLPIIGLLMADWKQRGFAVLVLAMGVMLAPKMPKTMVQDFSGISGKFQVVSAPRPSYSGERCIVDDGQRRFNLQFSKKSDIAYGDTVFLRGSLGPVSESSLHYWRYQGVSGQIRASEIRVLSRGNQVWGWGQSMRHSFVDFVNRNVRGDTGAVMKALCFNHDAELSQDLREDLRKSGTFHLISTSGLHVMIVSWFLGVLLRALPIPRWLQVLVLIAMLVVYAAASGVRPPMVRSVLMVLPILVAYLACRESDGLSLVAFSAIVTLIWMPYCVWDLGFQLSFLSVTGLVLFGPKMRQPKATISGWLGHRAKELAWASGVATVVTAPLLAFHFSRFSVIGIIGNLMVAPVVGVVTVGSLAAWMVDGLVPGLGGWVLRTLLAPLAEWLRFAVHLCGNAPFAEMRTPGFAAPWLWVIYLLIFSLWRPEQRPVDAEPPPTL